MKGFCCQTTGRGGFDWTQRTEEQVSGKARAKMLFIIEFFAKARMKLGASFRFHLIRNQIEEPSLDQI
jgi:hypothetical protein